MNALTKLLLLGGISKSNTGEHSDYSVCHEARYWEQKCYHDYMKKHGKHFSESLSKWAVSKNEWTNKVGSGEYWTAEQVETALVGLDIVINDTNRCDAYYLANTMYADHSSSAITDVIILQLVANIMNDKDGYDGMIFDIWLTKAMGKCWSIDWEKYI